MNEFSLVCTKRFVYFFKKFSWSNVPPSNPHFSPIGCFATSGDKPIGVRWLKNNEPLYEQSGLIKITNLDSISLLEFTATRVKDQANYTCELSNYLGKDLFTTELIVTGMQWSLIFLNALWCFLHLHLTSDASMIEVLSKVLGTSVSP